MLFIQPCFLYIFFSSDDNRHFSYFSFLTVDVNQEFDKQLTVVCRRSSSQLVM